MSFWKQSPGPTWWDCIESFNPCIQTPYGICNPDLIRKVRYLTLPKGFTVITLSSKHAERLEHFLKEHYSIYSRCRITLSKERIEKGFLLDDWVGVGVFTFDKQMVGCCISKPLGRMKFTQETINQSGLVDLFCVHKDYRKQGVAGFLLDELVVQTAKKERLVHIFLKEGFPLLSMPPVYIGRYITRRKEVPGESKDYFGSMGIALQSPIQSYSHADYLPLTKFVANLPWQLSGDSELSVFNYRGHIVFLCMTNLHHRTAPEGHSVGELSWFLPQTAEVPLSIQRLAIETCIDCSPYDIVLMDSSFPHSKKTWEKDESFSWYIFNYNPGGFFTMKPFWVF